jgi:hypothetical protein
MNQKSRTGGGAHERTEAGRSADVAPMLDAQYAELIELVWRCERVWTLEDRIDAVIRYSRADS